MMYFNELLFSYGRTLASRNVFVKCRGFQKKNHGSASLFRGEQVDKLLDMQGLDSYHAGTSSRSEDKK